VYFGLPEKEVKGTGGSSTDLPDALGTNSLFVIINRIITAFLGMVGAFTFAVFIYAGVTWMTAGSSDRVQHAKDTMKYAVIGLAMIALSYAITLFVIGALTRPASVQSTPAPEAAAPAELQ
jgi:amino acid transporter